MIGKLHVIGIAMYIGLTVSALADDNAIVSEKPPIPSVEAPGPILPNDPKYYCFYGSRAFSPGVRICSGPGEYLLLCTLPFKNADWPEHDRASWQWLKNHNECSNAPFLIP